MLPTLIDIALACLIAINLRRWWVWLPVSLLTGAIVAITYALGLASLDMLPPGEAVIKAIGTAPLHAIFCALCTWGFSRITAKP